MTMYELWKIQAGVMNMIESHRDSNITQRRAIEESRLNDAVYIVVRQGFGTALCAVWRGIVGDPVEIMRRMSAPSVPPIVERKPQVDLDAVAVPAKKTPSRRRKQPEETKARKVGASEHKVFPATVISADEATGIVEAVVNTYGIVDDGQDRVWYGSAAKTLAENAGRVRVLNSHNSRDVLNVVGKPLEIRELRRDELPPQILQQWPDATGGLYTKTQYLLDTPEGDGVFKRIKAGAVDEYSIGFDAIVTDMERANDPATGKNRVVRNIREIRLWEYSPVVWGMNPATGSVSVKAQETKPYDVFEMSGEYCVYKVDESGERMGDSLGCHATESEARDQVAALYAAETDSKEYTPQGVVKRLGDCLLAELLGEGTEKLAKWLEKGFISPDEYTMVLQPLTQHLTAFYNAIPQDIALREYPDLEGMMYSAGDPETAKAGRVLNERNYNAIKQASSLLTDVLTSAGLTDGDSDAMSADKSRDTSDTGPLLDSDTAPTPDGAGPQDDETPAEKLAKQTALLRERLAKLEA